MSMNKSDDINRGSNSETSGRIFTLGMENFSKLFDQNGVNAGKLLTLQSDPESYGDEVATLLPNGVTTHYFTLSHFENEIKNMWADRFGFDEENIKPVDISRSDAHNDLNEQLSNDRRFDSGDVIVINPVNLFFDNPEKYHDLLIQLKYIVNTIGGFAVLHKVNSRGSDTDGTWRTNYMSDIVLTIRNEKLDQNIKQELLIEKVDQGNRLMNDNERILELSVAQDSIDISSTRNISP